ncbi:IMPACT family protein [Parahaliea aestuarii]|uniref:YigZ family protein n=1 Tax=Parahaliea aestuarii TaxID=1852021 RepID=A0A5C8ZSM8_9GAMM|nr:YigZ family protein [Parahaliea aestuarii]TXS91533.1 YigZ family protein [Parahaliea aestuarii]
MAYAVVTRATECERIEKKSRFIARILPVSSREEVNAAVAQARSDYPDARHHCWAYLLGEPGDARSAGMNDDGEPAGTAGKPILNVLQHGHLGDVLVIVIRYFGGIKLGAGGLVRAYSAAARDALDAAPCAEVQAMSRWRARGDFACEQVLRHWLAGRGGEVSEVSYGEAVSLDLRVPATAAAELAELCAAHRIALEELL